MKKKIRTFLTFKILIMLSIFIANPVFSAEIHKIKKNSALKNKVETKNLDVIVNNLVKEGKLEKEKANSLKSSLKEVKNVKSHNKRAKIINSFETAGVISIEEAEELRNDDNIGEDAFKANFWGYLGYFAAVLLVLFLLGGL